MSERLKKLAILGLAGLTATSSMPGVVLAEESTEGSEPATETEVSVTPAVRVESVPEPVTEPPVVDHMEVAPPPATEAPAPPATEAPAPAPAPAPEATSPTPKAEESETKVDSPQASAAADPEGSNGGNEQGESNQNDPVITEDELREKANFKCSIVNTDSNKSNTLTIQKNEKSVLYFTKLFIKLQASDETYSPQSFTIKYKNGDSTISENTVNYNTDGVVFEVDRSADDIEILVNYGQLNNATPATSISYKLSNELKQETNNKPLCDGGLVKTDADIDYNSVTYKGNALTTNAYLMTDNTDTIQVSVSSPVPLIDQGAIILASRPGDDSIPSSSIATASSVTDAGNNTYQATIPVSTLGENTAENPVHQLCIVTENKFGVKKRYDLNIKVILTQPAITGGESGKTILQNDTYYTGPQCTFNFNVTNPAALKKIELGVNGAYTDLGTPTEQMSFNPSTTGKYTIKGTLVDGYTIDGSSEIVVDAFTLYPNNVGEDSVLTIDNTAPTVTITLSRPDATVNQVPYYRDSTTATVVVQDNVSFTNDSVSIVKHTNSSDIPVNVDVIPKDVDITETTSLIASASDEFGNQSDQVIKEVHIDKTAPSMTGSISDPSVAKIRGDTTHIPVLAVTLAPTDAEGESGVKSVEVYRNGSRVKTITSGYSYTIDTDGTYTFKVTDNVGRTTEYGISQLGITNGDGTSVFHSSNKVKVNKSAPTSRLYSTPDHYTKNSKDYYKSYPAVTFEIKDPEGSLDEDSVSCTIIKGSETLQGTISSKGNDLYEVTIQGTPGNKCEDITITVHASDIQGMSTSCTYGFYVDTEKPVISSSAVNNTTVVNTDDGVTYVNNKNAANKNIVTIQVTATDTNSGVKTYALMKGTQQVDSNTTGTFNIQASNSQIVFADYSVKVTDNVGNITEEPLATVLGKSNISGISSTSKFIIDITDPVVLYDNASSTEKPDYTSGSKKWFRSKEPSKLHMVYTITDPNLASISSAITNGSSTDTGTPNVLNNENTGYSVDNAKLKEGRNVVKVSATDKVGNTTKAADREVYIDTTKPSGLKIYSMTANGRENPDFENREDGLFFTSAPVIKLSAVDGEAAKSSGIAKYTASIDGSESNVNKDGTTLSSGKSYTNFKVYDNVSNVSDPLTLIDLITAYKHEKGDTSFTALSNKVVVDSAAPTIVMDELTPTAVVGQNKWFASLPTVGYTVRDNNLRSVKLTVKQGNNTKEFSYADTVRVNTLSPDGRYTIDLSSPTLFGNSGIVENTPVTISVEAYDKSRNHTKATDYVLYFDKTKPTVTTVAITPASGDSQQHYNTAERKTELYFKKTPKIKITTTDGNGSGVKDIYYGNTALTKTNANEATTDASENVNTFKVSDNVNNTSSVYQMSQKVVVDNTGINQIYVDGENPSISKSATTPDYVAGNTHWYAKKPSITYTIKDRFLKDVKITVTNNGKTYSLPTSKQDLLKEAENASKSYTIGVGASNDIDISGVTDGKVDIAITVTDRSGNSSSSSYSYMYDSTAPSVTSATITPAAGDQKYHYAERSEDLYFKKAPSVTINTTDGAGSGVRKIYYGNADLTKSDANTATTTMQEAVKTFKVDDNVLNTSKTYQLQELIKEGNAGIKNIYFDNENPTITAKYPNPDVRKNDLLWFKTKPTITYTVADRFLKDVAITVKNNGRTVSLPGSATNLLSVAENGSKTYTLAVGSSDIDMGFITDGKVDVTIKVTDRSGNSASGSYSFMYDSTAPVFQNDCELEGSFKKETTGAFFQDNPTVTIKANDGSGVGGVKYTMNGTDTNSSGKFKLGSGSYKFTVKDDLGNTSAERSLKSLLNASGVNLNSDTIVVDKEDPEITSFSKPSGALSSKGGSWYKTDQTIEASFSDNIAIKEASITINGKKFTSTPDDSKNVKTVRGFTASTAGISPLGSGEDPNYRYEVTAKVIDKSGRTAEKSFVIFIDKKAPTWNTRNFKFSNTPFDRDTGLFFDKATNVTIDADDEGVGMGTYSMDDGSQQSSGVFSLSNGRHSVSTFDKLGNKRGADTLQSLMKLSSNRMVIDTVAPSISCKKPSGGVNNWFAKDQQYDPVITDNEGILEASITINGTTVDSFKTHGTDEKNITLHANTSRVKAKTDGSYDVVVTVTDKAGHKKEWNDTIYIDKVAPKINKFIFTGTKSQDGAEINGSRRYGFFFEGSGTLRIYATDESPSSGLKHAIVTMGGTTKTVSFTSGVATLTIPSGFKGYISAYPVDNVDNKGTTERPDGVVSETSNMHVNAVNVSLSLPTTPYKDNSKLPLYNKDITVSLKAGCTISGISKVRWGIGNTEYGSTNVSGNGTANGVTITGKDDNLVIGISNSFLSNVNKNNQNVWVEITDRLGHTSRDERTISIDKDAPVMSISYLDGSRSTNGFYKNARTATITVQERNFDPNGFKVTGVAGIFGSWRQVRDGYWTTQMTFAKDDDYDFTATMTDLAGNTSKKLEQQKFSVDKTSPKLKVEFDNNDVQNEKYYKKSRTATITITDVNFDKSLVKYEGDGVLSAWVTDKKDPKVHTATVSFTKNGKYKFKVSCKDKAGNDSGETVIDEFIIDKVIPTIKIDGVQKNISYKKNVQFTVDLKDKNLDKDSVSVMLVGQNNGIVELEGKLDSTSGKYVFDGVPEDEKYDDIYTLRVEVADLAGNTKVETVRFSINRFGSKYEDTDNIFGTYLPKAQNVSIKESNLEKLEVDKCKIEVIKNGKQVNLRPGTFSIKEKKEKDKWSYTYTVDKSVFDEDGSYQVRVHSKMKDGTDYSSVAESYTFVLDTTAPEVIISGVEDRGQYQEYSRKATIDMRDLSGIDSYSIKLNGEEVETTEEGNLRVLTIQESSKLQDLEVTVRDMAGNVSTKEVNNFLITTSMFDYIVNQPWFRWGVGGLGVVGGSIGAFALFAAAKRRRKARKALEAQAKDIASSRSSSSKSGSSSSSSSSGLSSSGSDTNNVG